LSKIIIWEWKIWLVHYGTQDGPDEGKKKDEKQDEWVNLRDKSASYS
jgi:hypothetical protein